MRRVFVSCCFLCSSGVFLASDNFDVVLYQNLEGDDNYPMLCCCYCCAGQCLFLNTDKRMFDLFHCLAIFDATIEYWTTSNIHSARYVCYRPNVCGQHG